jgi:hypothetical protein
MEVKSNEIYQLMYENRNIIAQGDQQSMMDLKQSIEDLVRSNDVIDFVNKYHELYNESRGNNEDLRRLKDEIQNLTQYMETKH